MKLLNRGKLLNLGFFEVVLGIPVLDVIVLDVLALDVLVLGDFVITDVR